MKVGDLVKDFLTERIGIIVEKGDDSFQNPQFRVLWTTQGLSLFGPGSKEWMMWASLEVLNESR